MTAHAPLISTQDDLFHEEVSLLLPERFAINCKVLDNPVRQLESPEKRELCRLRPFSVRQITGRLRFGGFELSGNGAFWCEQSPGSASLRYSRSKFYWYASNRSCPNTDFK